MARLIAGLGAILLFVVSPAAADTALDSLLSAHADSMGLSREALPEMSWHVVGEVEALGLTGTIESWIQPPAAQRARLELGPVTLETWFDGEKGWISDRNGAAREAAGAELEGMLVQALFSTGAWLLENPPVPLAFAELAEAGTDTSLVLVCEPLFEQPLRIEIDRRTLLPIATSVSTASGEQRQVFLEWGRFGGMRVPLRERLELGDLLTVESRVRSIQIHPPRPIAFYQGLASGALAVPEDVVFTEPVVEAELLGDGLHLLVHGAVTDGAGEGVQIVLLVDTGAGASFLDIGAATRLGLDREGAVPTLGVGGRAESAFVTVPALEIGAVRVLEQSWMASDFSDLRSWFEHPPTAVLGYDFLSRVVFEVDYAARKLRFHAPDTFSAPEGATALPMRLDANIPSVEIGIEGIMAWVHVDTGSDGGLDLSAPFVEANGLLEGRQTREAGGLRGIGGTALTRRGVVDSLELGGLVLEEVTTGFNQAADGIFAREDAAGILGAGVLSQFRCWFDYPSGTLYLLPASD